MYSTGHDEIVTIKNKKHEIAKNKYIMAIMQMDRLCLGCVRHRKNRHFAIYNLLAVDSQATDPAGAATGRWHGKNCICIYNSLADHAGILTAKEGFDAFKMQCPIIKIYSGHITTTWPFISINILKIIR